MEVIEIVKVVDIYLIQVVVVVISEDLKGKLYSFFFFEQFIFVYVLLFLF